MSTPTEKDGVIVIHPPLTGEADAVAATVEEKKSAAGKRRKTKEPVHTTAPAAATRRAGAGNEIKEISTQALSSRAYGIDAYRGFFLLLMTFAMTVPMREGIFAEWMYHMQYPVPGDFVDRPGLTWRDLLFPAFLFTMCAAIPITNTLRLTKQMPYPAILWTAVKRFAILYLFALIIGHTLPYWTEDYTKRGNVIAIAGFLACWPIFMRRPDGWKEETFSRFKMAGWIAGAAILFALPAVYGSEFSLERRDGIIHALAFVSLITTTLWLFTRKNPLARMIVLLAVVALKVVTELELAGAGLLYSIEVPVIFQAWMVELLIVAIPASFAGDLIVDWMRTSDADEARSWSVPRLAAISLACLAFVPVALVGFFLRYPYETTAAFAAIAVLGVLLTWKAQTRREKIMATLFRGAALLLVIGAAIEPLGDGIKKDPQTLSYLVVTTGLSLALLIIALIAVDVLKSGKRVSRILIDVGQNPLIAYVAFTMFFNNIAWLTILPRWQPQTPGEAVGVGLVFTGLTALIAATATRKRIYWRA